jgi:hypothetical protein
MTLAHMVNAGLVGIVVVFTIIAAAFSSYYVTVSPINGQISSYQSEIASLSEHVSTVIVTSVTTQLVVSTITVTGIGGTTTSVTTLTSVSTSTLTEYPLESNVTVFFQNQNSSSLISYAIKSPTIDFAGSFNTNYTYTSTPQTPLYSGEMISITASCATNCNNATTFSATLYRGGTVAVQNTGSSLQPISINYTL